MDTDEKSEIIVTPEIVRAGINAMDGWDYETGPKENLVKRVFEAMSPHATSHILTQ